jgi:hypothetical protein
MKPVVSLIVVASILLLGIAIGVTAVVAVHHEAFGRIFLHHQDERLEVGDLEELLGLTAEQQQAVNSILQQSEEEVQAIHDEVLPRVQEHLLRTHERLLEILDPVQRARLDALHRSHGEQLEELLLDMRRSHDPRELHNHGQRDD